MKHVMIQVKAQTVMMIVLLSFVAMVIGMLPQVKLVMMAINHMVMAVLFHVKLNILI